MTRKFKIALLSFVLANICFSTPVHAYIDPATTTYIIQIVTALIITLGVTIGVFFTRVRLSIVELYVRFSEFFIRLFSKRRDKNGKSSRTSVAERSAITEDLSFRRRFFSAICVSIAFAFTFIVFGIYELYMLNIESFNFPLNLLFPYVLLLGASVAILLTIVLVLFRGRLFTALISLVFGILLAGYIQGNFLNRGLGILTGDQIDWSTQARSFLGNTLIWFAIVSIPFLLKALKKKVWSVTIKTVSCLLVIVQIVSMFAIYSSELLTPKPSNRYLSMKGINEIAKEKNIIIFTIDRLDNTYIRTIMKGDPNFFDRLDGFTQFTNNMSLYSQTFPSVANMFTGELHLFDRPQREYLKKTWTESTFIPKLRSQQYASYFYMEPGYTFRDASDLEHIADNVVENEIRIRTRDALMQFVRLSAFRCDKMALAALEHTLRLYFDDEMARRHIPILSMALVEPEELKRRTELFADKLKTHGIQATVEPSSMVMGGGTAPELYLDSWACVIDPALQEGALSPSVIDANLRASSRPVICRLVQDRLFFDLRTVRCDEEDLLIDNLMHAMKTECQS
jgi:hypothetical protein